MRAAWHGSLAGIKLQIQRAINAAHVCIRDVDLAARPECVRLDAEQFRLTSVSLMMKCRRTPATLEQTTQSGMMERARWPKIKPNRLARI
jgi:hypothetical protein